MLKLVLKIYILIDFESLFDIAVKKKRLHTFMSCECFLLRALLAGKTESELCCVHGFVGNKHCTDFPSPTFKSF